MTNPLMPKATAVWLVDNSGLTFKQIADFCGLHPLEVQGIADGEVALNIAGLDPVTGGQLTREEIKRCESDPSARLKLAVSNIPDLSRMSCAKPGGSLILAFAKSLCWARMLTTIMAKIRRDRRLRNGALAD